MSLRLELADVRRVIEDDALIPCFQPVIEMHTGRLAGFEVLARWQHPQLGPILPRNFIAIAEANDLIGTLMQQIMHKAFQSPPVLPEPLSLGVNVSPAQLHDLSLPGQIRSAAENTGFPLHRLIVEITENGLVDNFETAQSIIGELKEFGCQLALDDFGTGYSNMSHLQSLPIDALKIDQSFVSAMTKTRESRKIVAAIIGLAHSLGMFAVAEGIETAEQAEMLLWLGSEFGQGWFYGKPVTAGKIPSAVASIPQKLTARPLDGDDRWVVSSLEAEPAQRLAQLQAIYDGAPVGLCFLDCNLRYVSLNRRLADMDGVQMSAYMGKTVKEVIPQVFPFFEPYLLRALKGEAITEVEISVPSPRAGEAVRTSLLSYQPALDEAGEVIGVSLSAVDISERKRTEDALRASEDHLRYMIDRNPEVQWAMDSDGNILDVNSGWTKLTGMSREKMRNLGWLEALHPEDVEQTMKVLVQALHTGKAVDIEYRVKSVDSGWRWVRSRGTPRVGSAGEIVRWYGSVEDIDERKQIEETERKGKA
jgi:PAS domain S-box-containing protein